MKVDYVHFTIINEISRHLAIWDLPTHSYIQLNWTEFIQLGEIQNKFDFYQVEKICVKICIFIALKAFLVQKYFWGMICLCVCSFFVGSMVWSVWFCWRRLLGVLHCMLYGVVVWIYYGIAGCFHSLWFWSSLWSPFNVQCNGLMGVVSGFGEYCRSTFWSIYMCLWACCCIGVKCM